MSLLQGGGIAVGTAIGGPVGGAVGGVVTGAFSPGGIFGAASPRSGGADPCCPTAAIEGEPCRQSGRLIANRNQNGAPPDFRDLGQPSPSGVGRLKDDACDCVPVEWPAGSGRKWVIDPGKCLWVEVTQPRQATSRDFIAGGGVAAETQERKAVEAGIFNLPAVNPMILLVVVGLGVALAFVFGQRAA